MQPLTLYFPDAAAMAEFILTERISGAETSNTYVSLKAVLEPEQISKAMTEFGATLKHPILS